MVIPEAFTPNLTQNVLTMDGKSCAMMYFVDLPLFSYLINLV